MSLDQLTPIILPFIILLLLALAAPIVREAYRMLRSVRVRLRSRAAKAAIDALTAIAGTAVAAAAAEVRDLKDPTKPGSWNASVARSIRERVINEVMLLGRDLIAHLRVIGAVDPEAVYELLERMVEAQVERLRRLDPSSSPAPLTSADLEEPRPTMAPSVRRGSTIPISVAPPPSEGQRGTVRVGAVAVLLALAVGALAVGAVLSGCPNWSRPACPRAGVYSCVGDQPHVCSPTGELTPIGDEACAAQRRACAVDDAGVAYCARAEDGGVR